MVESAVRRCMMMWLPRLRTSTKPLAASLAQTARPERTRSLPNRHFQASHENLGVKTALDFRRVGRLEEQLDGLDEILPRGLDGISLARDVELRTERNVPVAFAFDDPGDLVCALHVG
jgi:hypothetical protein